MESPQDIYSIKADILHILSRDVNLYMIAFGILDVRLIDSKDIKDSVYIQKIVIAEVASCSFLNTLKQLLTLLEKIVSKKQDDNLFSIKTKILSHLGGEKKEELVAIASGYLHMDINKDDWAYPITCKKRILAEIGNHEDNKNLSQLLSALESELNKKDI